jgi:hypothetical protein
MSPQTDLELLGLAPELVANVIKQVEDKRDLSNVRLTCKTLKKHGSKELFRDIFVSPSEEHMHSWNSISQDDVIRKIPRHAIIHTQSSIEDDSPGNEDQFSEEFEGALAALSRFPNLDSVEIGFTPQCAGAEKGMFHDVAEDVSEREEMFTLIFKAIMDRAADVKNRTIRRLTIINLQNCHYPEFTSSDLFCDVMRQLEELHISITQEHNSAGSDHDHTKVELQTFPAYLCSDWLEPISANLRALSIYNRTDNWGPFPGYFDPSGISFPKLEMLALGYYTLAHDNDFDWVLATKSLRKLILQNCMINSWIRIESENMAAWEVRTHDWIKMPDESGGGRYENFAYGGKWSQHLDRITESLPNLVDFRFEQQSPYGEPPYSVTDRNSCSVGIFPQRYICFDGDHWLGANDDGEMHSWLNDDFPNNAHKQNLEADQESLDALLQRLRT